MANPENHKEQQNESSTCDTFSRLSVQNPKSDPLSRALGAMFKNLWMQEEGSELSEMEKLELGIKERAERRRLRAVQEEIEDRKRREKYEKQLAEFEGRRELEKLKHDSASENRKLERIHDEELQYDSKLESSIRETEHQISELEQEKVKRLEEQKRLLESKNEKELEVSKTQYEEKLSRYFKTRDENRMRAVELQQQEYDRTHADQLQCESILDNLKRENDQRITLFQQEMAKLREEQNILWDSENYEEYFEYDQRIRELLRKFETEGEEEDPERIAKYRDAERIRSRIEERFTNVQREQRERIARQAREEAELEAELQRMEAEYRAARERQELAWLDRKEQIEEEYDCRIKPLVNRQWALTMERKYSSRLNFYRAAGKIMKPKFEQLAQSLITCQENLERSESPDKTSLTMQAKELRTVAQNQKEVLIAEISNLENMHKKAGWPFLNDIRESLQDVLLGCDNFLDEIDANFLVKLNLDQTKTGEALRQMYLLYTQLIKSYSQLPTMDLLEPEFEKQVERNTEMSRKKEKEEIVAAQKAALDRQKQDTEKSKNTTEMQRKWILETEIFDALCELLRPFSASVGELKSLKETFEYLDTDVEFGLLFIMNTISNWAKADNDTKSAAQILKSKIENYNMIDPVFSEEVESVLTAIEKNVDNNGSLRNAMKGCVDNERIKELQLLLPQIDEKVAQMEQALETARRIYATDSGFTQLK